MAERSFGEQLARESKEWVAEGLVTAEQAETLRSRYEGAGEARRSRAAAALAVIGALAVGFGVIGFLAANWDALPHPARLALITVAIAGSYAGGYWLCERTGRHPRVGEALYLLGVLLFGAALFLVGQMYHVEAHDPLALLLWAAAAFAVAAIVRSRAIAWAAWLIFSGWIGFEAGTALGDDGGSGSALAVLAVFYGGALYGLGTAAVQRVRRDWLDETGFAVSARLLGLAVFTAGLFVFTFSGAADDLDGAGAELGGALEAGLVVLAAVALAAAAVLAVDKRRSSRYGALVLAVSVGALLVAVYVGGDGGLYALLFNLLLATVALGAIFTGYDNDEPWLVNAGVVLVAIDLVARYFDVFWSALPRSVGMIGAGLLVLGIAYGLERQRRRLLERMEAA
ncbi:MAG: DUF2157 domain-containing protein [Actinobacteria bacterium]|nr:DUF2157 domain-containing protein [Actinomycetota bacterium]